MYVACVMMTPDTLSFFFSGDGLLWTALLLLLVTVSLAVIQGFRLMRRYYARPYSLAAASAKQKVRWAFHIVLWKSSWLIIVVYLLALTTPSLQDKLSLVLICGGLWLFALPFMVLMEIRAMNRWLKGYKEWDIWLRSSQAEGKGHKLIRLKFVLSLLKTEEMERFAVQGYSKQAVS